LKRPSLPYELQLGWRYTRAGKRTTGNGFISFIALISMMGIALGVAALIIVLSVMNGFQTEVRDRMLSVLAHIEIFSPTAALSDWQRTADQAMRHPAVLASAPYIEAQALLSRAGSIHGVLLRGIDPLREPGVSDLGRDMVQGQLTALTAGQFGIVLGAQLADNLEVKIGDTLTLITPQGTLTPAGLLPRLKAFTVSGIFESGHYEFDSMLALIHLADAQALFRLPGPTGIRLRIDDMQRAPHVAQALAAELPLDLISRDWTQQNQTWFAAVQIEKRMMFIILTLIITVAAFNLVSSLVMTVASKQADIAILRTLGAQKSEIMRLFIIQGMTIGLFGVLLGVASGCAIAVNIPTLVPIIERMLNMRFLPSSVYFISELPSDLNLGDVAWISTVACLLSVLATLYPSWRAARVQPAQALRHE
jgi:lipoprotein-releasing system permease protein